MPTEGSPAGAGPDPERLAAAMAALGLAARVEAHGALAVLVMHGTTELPDGAGRAAIVAAARAAGFASVALEIAPDVTERA